MSLLKSRNNDAWIRQDRDLESNPVVSHAVNMEIYYAKEFINQQKKQSCKFFLCLLDFFFRSLCDSGRLSRLKKLYQVLFFHIFFASRAFVSQGNYIEIHFSKVKAQILVSISFHPAPQSDTKNRVWAFYYFLIDF